MSLGFSSCMSFTTPHCSAGEARTKALVEEHGGEDATFEARILAMMCMMIYCCTPLHGMLRKDFVTWQDVNVCPDSQTDSD